jgi:hypothetical protein
VKTYTLTETVVPTLAIANDKIQQGMHSAKFGPNVIQIERTSLVYIHESNFCIVDGDLEH